MHGNLLHNGESIANQVSVTLRRSLGGWGGVLLLPKEHRFDPKAHRNCTLALSGRQGEIECMSHEGARVTFGGKGPLSRIERRPSGESTV